MSVQKLRSPPSCGLPPLPLKRPSVIVIHIPVHFDTLFDSCGNNAISEYLRDNACPEMHGNPWHIYKQSIEQKGSQKGIHTLSWFKPFEKKLCFYSRQVALGIISVQFEMILLSDFGSNSEYGAHSWLVQELHLDGVLLCQNFHCPRNYLMWLIAGARPDHRINGSASYLRAWQHKQFVASWGENLPCTSLPRTKEL